MGRFGDYRRMSRFFFVGSVCHDGSLSREVTVAQTSYVKRLTGGTLTVIKYFDGPSLGTNSGAQAHVAKSWSMSCQRELAKTLNEKETSIGVVISCVDGHKPASHWRLRRFWVAWLCGWTRRKRCEENVDACYKNNRNNVLLFQITSSLKASITVFCILFSASSFLLSSFEYRAKPSGNGPFCLDLWRLTDSTCVGAGKAFEVRTDIFCISILVRRGSNVGSGVQTSDHQSANASILVTIACQLYFQAVRAVEKITVILKKRLGIDTGKRSTGDR